MPNNIFYKDEIQAVIFDMDGLMFDSERIVKLSWNRVMTSLEEVRLWLKKDKNK